MKQLKLKSGFLFIVMSVSFSFAAHGEKYRDYKPSPIKEDKNKVVIVEWNTSEGLKRLARSKFKSDFYQLAHFAETQINPVYCAVASSVSVLNAMRVPKNKVPSQSLHEIKKPAVWGGDTLPFEMYTQDTFLNEKTDVVKKREIIELKNVTKENTNNEKSFDPGLMLAELKDILVVYGTNVEMTHADEDAKTGLPKFISTVKKVSVDSDKFIIANFKGETYGSPMGGHMSPVVAYDEGTTPSLDDDSVLVLDVGGYLNPWNWVPVKDFYAAMHTVDVKYRGYLVVSDKI